MRATVCQLIPQVYHLCFDRHRELCHAVLRFQEHYESSRFRGRVFTRREFAVWYARERGNGVFSYASDSLGFNLPWYALRPFYAGRFDPLSRDERVLLSCFGAIPTPFYIIATSQQRARADVVDHELAHALWALRDEYRSCAQTIIRTLPAAARAKLRRYLEDHGYHADVFEDEMHAYLLIGKCVRLLELEHVDGQVERLRKLFRQYGGNREGLALAAGVMRV